MIKIENVDVYGWDAAIRGMRNPMNSWEKSDTAEWKDFNEEEAIGSADHELMTKLAKAGSEHAKYRRFINVTMDVTAPLYWWKEFDTYKVGTVSNSCSTMHKIADKKFTLEDFSCEHLGIASKDILEEVVNRLNTCREYYLLDTSSKKYWWQMIQLLPSSYNQRRTLQLNYEVLASIYRQRKGHKLDEWNDFCAWIETLPYSELITGERDD